MLQKFGYISNVITFLSTLLWTKKYIINMNQTQLQSWRIQTRSCSSDPAQSGLWKKRHMSNKQHHNNVIMHISNQIYHSTKKKKNKTKTDQEAQS